MPSAVLAVPFRLLRPDPSLSFPLRETKAGTGGAGAGVGEGVGGGGGGGGGWVEGFRGERKGKAKVGVGKTRRTPIEESSRVPVRRRRMEEEGSKDGEG